MIEEELKDLFYKTLFENFLLYGCCCPCHSEDKCALKAKPYTSSKEGSEKLSDYLKNKGTCGVDSETWG